MVALLLACATTVQQPDGRIDGRTWSSLDMGLAIDFPQGWVITTEPESFRGGLSATVLEGRHEDTQMALTWHPVRMPGFGQASALDLLHLLAPMVQVRSDPDYRLERLPGCMDAVERRFEGWTQVGLRAPGGLVLLQSWSGEELRSLSCSSLRWL